VAETIGDVGGWRRGLIYHAQPTPPPPDHRPQSIPHVAETIGDVGGWRRGLIYHALRHPLTPICPPCGGDLGMWVGGVGA